MLHRVDRGWKLVTLNPTLTEGIKIARMMWGSMPNERFSLVRHGHTSNGFHGFTTYLLLLLLRTTGEVNAL